VPVRRRQSFADLTGSEGDCDHSQDEASNAERLVTRYRVGINPPGASWPSVVAELRRQRPAASPGDWFDPTFLQRIAPAAIKVTIADGEKKTQDLRIGGG
jgi:hypothetical protein